MNALKNHRHERFAQHCAEGCSGTAAYLKVYPDVKTSTAEANAARLLGNAKVRARVEEIQAAGAARVEIQIGDLVETAREILFAPPNTASAEHPLAEVGMSKAGPYYRFPSKMEALEKIAKLKGFYAPVEAKATVPGLAELLASIVRPGLPVEPGI